MSNQMPLYVYMRTGFAFTVYQNRIEIKSGAFVPKVETITIRSITNVETSGILGKIKISTSDGKKHEYLIGVEAPQARTAILDLL